ncbi:DUF1572 family protein [Paenibacillus sp. LPE1-1-1.1]|uniref:DUF1572 family protein n=1 Tax=Paenibacillus sp. LPE1-1-1.1 TaxID=3135230 RepID=UPI00342D107F
MHYQFNREWLIHKFEEIRRRILKAVDQLDDEQLNWRPDETSHSISMLIKHIEGNMLERIVKRYCMKRSYVTVRMSSRKPS